MRSRYCRHSGESRSPGLFAFSLNPGFRRADDRPQETLPESSNSMGSPARPGVYLYELLPCGCGLCLRVLRREELVSRRRLNPSCPNALSWHPSPWIPTPDRVEDRLFAGMTVRYSTTEAIAHRVHSLLQQPPKKQGLYLQPGRAPLRKRADQEESCFNNLELAHKKTGGPETSSEPPAQVGDLGLKTLTA